MRPVSGTAIRRSEAARNPSKAIAAAAVLAAAALFGTSATSQHLLVPEAPALSVASMRLLVGAVGLVAFVALRGGVAGRARGRADLIALWRRPVLWVMGAAVAGYQGFFFLSTSRTGVAVGTLISLAVAPFLAGVLGWALREGAPGWVWALSTVIAIAGVTLLMAGNIESGDGWGMTAAVAAGTCYAVYTVLGVRLARGPDAADASAVLAAAFTVGALVLLPFALTSDWWRSPSGIVEVLWLGLVATTLAYLLFGIGLRVLQPGHIATLNLLEPAVATLLGVVVLGEAMAATGWIGCLLVVGALALLGIAETRPESPREAIGEGVR